MSRSLIPLFVGAVMLCGCGRLSDAAIARGSAGLIPDMSGRTVLTLQNNLPATPRPAMILVPVSVIPLIGPSATSHAAPVGIPDMSGMRFFLYPGSHVALVTQDGHHWRGQAYRLGDDLAFGVELPGGARLQGVMHLLKGRKHATFVVTLTAMDALGTTFAGTGEFRAFTPVSRRHHVSS